MENNAEFQGVPPTAVPQFRNTSAASYSTADTATASTASTTTGITAATATPAGTRVSRNSPTGRDATCGSTSWRKQER